MNLLKVLEMVEYFESYTSNTVEFIAESIVEISSNKDIIGGNKSIGKRTKTPCTR